MLVKLKEESHFPCNAEISNVGFQRRKISVKTGIGRGETEESSTKRRELPEFQGQRNGIACTEKGQNTCGGKRKHRPTKGKCSINRESETASTMVLSHWLQELLEDLS